jgi:signal transduction histidine kinase/CheY-like chemotaxis protein
MFTNNMRLLESCKCCQEQYIDEKLPDSRQLEFQAHLLDNINKSIVVITKSNEIIYCNQCAINVFNISLNEQGSFNKGTFHFDQNKLDLINKHICSGATWKEEERFVLDGIEKTVMHRVSLFNKNEPSGEIAIISYDISKLVKSRQNAETANISKNHFLANITHELRTPMIGILGSVDLLQHNQLSAAQQANVETIRECGERLLEIIDDILDVSKIGLLQLNTSPANLSEVIKKAISIKEVNLRTKGLLLELDIGANLPKTVLLDHVKLHQVLINLLTNAINFTPRGGIKVTVSLERNSKVDWISFSVADTGIGIPSNKLGSIFDYFTQVDASTSREFGGTGLGLYICKKLVDLMSGEIWVTSQEGMGTTFGFKIPLEIELSKQEENIFDVSPNIPASDDFPSEFIPISVLLVEDNELNQKLVAQMLINFGFEVITANNGLEGLNILQYKDVDIVLMDMQMPIMDGYEATRIIRMNRSWDDLPIIAITANSMRDDRDKCLACGCSSYLAKPFKSETLVREIRTYLKNRFIKDKGSRSDPLSQQLIAELLPEFIEMLEEILNDLQDAIEIKDLDGVKNISHGLKGTAGMYGFMHISELASLIEKATVDKNYQKMSLLYHQILSDAKDLDSRISSNVVL